MEKYNDEFQYGYRVRDGFCFTRTGIVRSPDDDSHIAVSVFKTFMNESKMQSSQLQAINIEQLQNVDRLLSNFAENQEVGVWSMTVEK